MYQKLAQHNEALMKEGKKNALSQTDQESLETEQSMLTA